MHLFSWKWSVVNDNCPLIVGRYVEGVVTYYYRSDNDVIRDSELQSWINEIIVFGRLEDEKRGKFIIIEIS